MRFTALVSGLFASPSVLAMPTGLYTEPNMLVNPRATSPKPALCARNFSITRAETEARFYDFAHAFVYKPNITKAFSYIAEDYINHNPSASNGFDAAWSASSPTWNALHIKPLSTTFHSPQGWINYKISSREIVGRYRMEGGCIVEHSDRNERFPAKALGLPVSLKSGASPITHCC